MHMSQQDNNGHIWVNLPVTLHGRFSAQWNGEIQINDVRKMLRLSMLRQAAMRMILSMEELPVALRCPHPSRRDQWARPILLTIEPLFLLRPLLRTKSLSHSGIHVNCDVNKIFGVVPKPGALGVWGFEKFSVALETRHSIRLRRRHHLRPFCYVAYLRRVVYSH